MKIGIDCRIYSSKFTGIGRYTHELVEHFIKINNEQNRKHEFVLFFNGPEYKKYQPPNLAVKKVLVNAPHYSFAEQTKFLRILNKEKCDIVHFPHFNLPILYRRPFTVTIHDLTVTFFPGRKKFRWHHRLAYHLTIKNAAKRSKKVIAVSQNTKDDIIEYLKIDPEKIEVIHNGIGEEFTVVDPEKCKKTLHKYGIKQEFLLYTGVWRYHKNLPRLVAAFEKIKQDLDIQLVITGKPDPQYPEVQEVTNNLGLQKDVIFTGHVREEELIHLYNAARIYVFPSLYEGFGLPPLESMKCGTPVAASNSSSIPEVCGEGNAVFFDPTNVDDIAAKITMLYKDADLQAQLVEKGAAHASHLTWEKSARKTFDSIIRSTLN